MPLITFLTICLIWGSNFILMHRTALVFTPLTIAFWRLFLGGGILLIGWLFTERRTLSLRDWPHLVLVALLGNAIPFVLLPMVIARGFGHSFFAVVVAFVPLVTVVAAGCMLGEWPTRRQLVGVLGGLLALIVLMWDGQIRGMTMETLLLAITVPVTYAIGNTYIRWKLSNAPVLPMTAVFLLVGAAFLLPVMFLFGTDHDLPASNSHEYWTAVISLLWLGVVGTGLAGAAFVWLIQLYGPLYAGMAAYLVPIVAIGWGAYDQEHVSLLQLVAIAIVVAMVILVQRRTSSV